MVTIFQQVSVVSDKFPTATSLPFAYDFSAVLSNFSHFRLILKYPVFMSFFL